MKRIVYSPEAIKKIREIYRSVRSEHGEEKAREVKRAITGRIRLLKTMEKQGISMYEMYGVLPDYRKLYVQHNHVFYLIEDKTIRIVGVYHEKEDFMWKLFGIQSDDDCESE